MDLKRIELQMVDDAVFSKPDQSQVVYGIVAPFRYMRREWNVMRRIMDK